MSVFDPLRLDGKVIVVTGATQGLGAAIARRAAALGAAGIAVCGRNRERGEAIAAELNGLFVPVELADPESCRAVMPAVQARFGRVDGLVNSAGLSTRGTLDDTSVELWDRLFAVNARAPFLLMQGAARLMRWTGGSVVNIITMSSHGGQPELMAYSASKGALAILTRNTAYALQDDRIRVNGLNIGWTATEGEHAVQGGGEWLQDADASRPFGRLLRPDDIAPMVTHLLSDAAAMITGSVMDYDQTVLGTYA